MRILYVCTANICRSASAQQLLRGAVAVAPELAGIEVRSAGTAAQPGSPGCGVAPAMLGHAAEHQSQLLTAELVAWADLILPAARDHRPVILQLEPSSRTRTFTVRQAGRIADWIVDSGMVSAGRERRVWAEGAGRGSASGVVAAGGGPARAEDQPPAASGVEVAAWAERFAPGDPRRDVQALPEDPAGRWLWIVSEMDAARGLEGAPRSATGADAPTGPRRRWRLGRGGRSTGQVEDGFAEQSRSVSVTPDSRDQDGIETHPDDVPDPHFLGMGLHPLAYEQIRDSTDSLVRLLREVAASG